MNTKVLSSLVSVAFPAVEKILDGKGARSFARQEGRTQRGRFFSCFNRELFRLDVRGYGRCIPQESDPTKAGSRERDMKLSRLMPNDCHLPAW